MSRKIQILNLSLKLIIIWMFGCFLNPFRTRVHNRNLLLITDLSGQIVHASGNPNIINHTFRTLFLKNFFQDLLTNEARYDLYEELSSQQILPKNVNSRQFTAMLRLPGKKIHIKQYTQNFKIKCYRTYVQFSPELQYKGRTNIREENEKQFKQINQQGQEAILVYIESIRRVINCESSSNSQKQRRSPILQKKNQFIQQGNIMYKTPEKAIRYLEKTINKQATEAQNKMSYEQEQ